MFDALIKVGGSLYRTAELRSSVVHWAALAERHRLLVLPGGGPFADQVRAADRQHRLSASAAHWMAILAMDQYAHMLADLTPRAALVRDVAAAGASCAAGQLAVLAPAELLRRADPLPHSWQVTSNSLAGWLAGFIGAETLILLKNVAGVLHTENGTTALLRDIPRPDLAGYAVVDPFFTHALPAHVTCWIIDGRRPERLVELLSTGSTLGTRVIQP